MYVYVKSPMKLRIKVLMKIKNDYIIPQCLLCSTDLRSQFSSQKTLSSQTTVHTRHPILVPVPPSEAPISFQAGSLPDDPIPPPRPSLGGVSAPKVSGSQGLSCDDPASMESQGEQAGV
jgi:hypothetical protein